MTGESVEVIMPKMGESIMEATITKWHKAVGESVQEGELLLEISTAKVEVEIPAPSSGVISAILHQEGDTVPVDEVIAILGDPASVPAALSPSSSASSSNSSSRPAAAEPASPVCYLDPQQEPAAPSTQQVFTYPRNNGGMTRSEEDLERERRRLAQRRSSPLVRKMAREHGIDLSHVEGTGAHGRVTARDFQNYIARREEMTTEQAKEAARGWDLAPEVDMTPVEPSEVPIILPMSQMRKLIAENLLRSIRTIPHAYTVHEIDFTRVEQLRAKYKDRFQQVFNLRLTPLVLLMKACAEALLRVPAVNAAWKIDHIERMRKANIGVAVAVKDGLLVPVLKNVEKMSLVEISRDIATLAGKARVGKLKPEDLQGGTFSITSPGQLGASFAIPIINQQQGAILHFGAIHKVPAVITNDDGTDAIAIRQHAMLTLGIDHRLVDGWDADRFMSAVRDKIEKADFEIPEEIR